MDLRADWIAEQRVQASHAIFVDHLDFTLSSQDALQLDSGREGALLYHTDVSGYAIGGLERVGGLDISFRDGFPDEGIATIVVCAYPSMAVIESISRSIVHSAPYIPSFLSFREAAPLASLVDELRETGRPLPQVLLVDGNGRLHPRQVGSAVAVGLLTGIPTIGVAKEFHPYDLNEKGSETEGTPRIQHQFAHLRARRE